MQNIFYSLSISAKHNMQDVPQYGAQRVSMNSGGAMGVLMDLEQQIGNDPKCLKTNLPAFSHEEKLRSRERHLSGLGSHL